MLRRQLPIVLVGLLAFSSGCHRRMLEGRERPVPEPMPPVATEEPVSTTTTTGAEVSAEVSKEAWGPLPAAPVSEPVMTTSPPTPPAPEPTTAPAPAQQQAAPVILPPPVYVMPSEQEPEPPKRVGPPSAADRNTWAGSVAQ